MTPFCKVALVCNQSHTSRGLRFFFRDQEKKNKTKSLSTSSFIYFFDRPAKRKAEKRG
jgi:hypothetical protein